MQAITATSQAAIRELPPEDGRLYFAQTFNAGLFQRFIEYTDVREETLKGYVTCLRRFAAWLQAEGIEQPTRADIRTYKTYLQEQGYSAATQQRYFQAVKHFFKWTAAEYLYPNIADNLKGARHNAQNTSREAFTETDVRTIAGSIDTGSEAGKRNYALVLLMVTGGLRLCEISRADIGDIETIKQQRVLYIRGKGRDAKDEYAKLAPEVDRAISEYLQTRENAKKSDPLFTGTGNRAKGQRMSVSALSRIVKDVLKSAGYDSAKYTAHSFRHTSNTLLFKAGADLYTVQKHARHSDPKTTEIYIHAVEREADRSEERIYNQIFNPQANAARSQIEQLLASFSERQQLAALAALQAIASENQ